ncbi:BTB/POZ and MATH domain-containing protein 1-like isoform X2 [Diospyros lotus]|uniref:BTB/POZ and MATH domain-containing protein 1-like isoform X1 n=1 Tax=Diospyros lotus TaxID=55363 RepID=UPI00224D289F|nr:BTB/POZ and MATH domain-containing protein 1-like isoform X1 [Diospyros lotus]XP_052173551.1 BTB/POZ and MATH domain-containing protein 1-like isoform X2 [Diospyros lotus]
MASPFQVSYCSKQMSEKGTQKISDLDGVLEVSRSMRHVRPAHYLFKIEAFSLLSEFDVEKWESDDFESGGYKWGLCLYPNGDEKRNGNGHISLYLVIRDTNSLPPGWEVYVQFKLFALNHIQDKYLTVQEGKTRCFRAMKTEWGFPQFLSLDSFENTQSGYLLDNSCEFGAEVFVIKYDGKGECLSIVKEPSDNTFTWKINKFSTITDTNLHSEEFKVGDHKWKLSLYPRGQQNSSGDNISLFLVAVDHTKLHPHRKLYAKYKLRVRNQVGHAHLEKEACCGFSASVGDWGFWDFKKLSHLNDPSEGYVVKDTLVVEVEIMAMSVLKKFP